MLITRLAPPLVASCTHSLQVQCMGYKAELIFISAQMSIRHAAYSIRHTVMRTAVNQAEAR